MTILGLDIYDVLALTGAGCLEYGVYCAWPPGAWMLGGVLLMAVAVWPNLRKRVR